jgi:cation diffusion facilitator CzcD-associated flavoprotein CzcO
VIPGLGDFKGHLAHSARWDDTYDFAGKTVAVIGSGSSAIQMVPELQAGKVISISQIGP